MSEVNNLEEQARKRQERLKSLKRKREEKHEEVPPKEDQPPLPKPKFRSYKPQDQELTNFVVKKPEIPDSQNEVKDLLDLAKSNAVIEQLDISTLAPRQPDWDLKRDVEKKLEKLAKRTQKAMAELIREKLKEKQDLAEVSNAPVNI